MGLFGFRGFHVFCFGVTVCCLALNICFGVWFGLGSASWQCLRCFRFVLFSYFVLVPAILLVLGVFVGLLYLI